MRVHLNVAGQDLGKHLKGLKVRPFVLLKLLEVLIDSNHEVFRGKGSPQELKARMRQLVQQEYPETEEGIPEEDRVGAIPLSLLQAMREREEDKRRQEEEGATWNKRLKLFQTKNSTPGEKSTCITHCLDTVRPHGDVSGQEQPV